MKRKRRIEKRERAKKEKYLGLLTEEERRLQKGKEPSSESKISNLCRSGEVRVAKWSVLREVRNLRVPRSCGSAAYRPATRKRERRMDKRERAKKDKFLGRVTDEERRLEKEEKPSAEGKDFQALQERRGASHEEERIEGGSEAASASKLWLGGLSARYEEERATDGKTRASKEA